MKFEDVLPGFREGKQYIHKGFIYQLSGSRFYYRTIGSDCWTKSSNNIINFIGLDWELFEEPLKALTLHEAVLYIESGGRVWNDYNGENFHYYKSGESLFYIIRCNINDRNRWNITSEHFCHTWYKVKS